MPSGVPTASSNVAFEWRKECQPIFGIFSSSHAGTSCRFVRLRRLSGVPFFVRNTSASRSTLPGCTLDRISTPFTLKGTVRLLERVLGSSKCPS